MEGMPVAVSRTFQRLMHHTIVSVRSLLASSNYSSWNEGLRRHCWLAGSHPPASLSILPSSEANLASGMV